MPKKDREEELTRLQKVRMGPEERRFHQRFGAISPDGRLKHRYGTTEELYAALNRDLDHDIKEMCECLCTPPEGGKA